MNNAERVFYLFIFYVLIYDFIYCRWIKLTLEATKIDKDYNYNNLPV